jgi:hypothetical protein
VCEAFFVFARGKEKPVSVASLSLPPHRFQRDRALSNSPLERPREADSFEKLTLFAFDFTLVFSLFLSKISTSKNPKNEKLSLFLLPLIP